KRRPPALCITPKAFAFSFDGIFCAGKFWWVTKILSHGSGIVGRFLGDVDVVGMALLEARAGDLDKLRLLVEFGDGGAAAVTHTGPDAAHQLEDGVSHGALVRHTALNALGNQLFAVLLEVPVL